MIDRMTLAAIASAVIDATEGPDGVADFLSNAGFDNDDLRAYARSVLDDDVERELFVTGLVVGVAAMRLDLLI